LTRQPSDLQLNPIFTATQIVDAVIFTLGIEKEDLFLKLKSYKEIRARHACMFFIRMKTDYTLLEIAKHFGLKREATANYGVRQFRHRCNTNDQDYMLLEQVCAKLG